MTYLCKILKYLANLVKTESLTINNASFVYPVTLHRRCGVVMMTFTDTQNLTNGQHILFTLPEGWRPIDTVYQLISNPLSTAYDIRMGIYTNGVVSIYYYGSVVTRLNVANTVSWIAK